MVLVVVEVVVEVAVEVAVEVEVVVAVVRRQRVTERWVSRRTLTRNLPLWRPSPNSLTCATG